MDVTVIMPTFNNSAMLATTLSAFEHVRFPATAELIVVDNNSPDDTADVVRCFSGRLPVRYTFEPKQGISPAKNRGAALAAGQLLIFTDDDVRPDPAWIETYLFAHGRNPTGLFWGGPVVSDFEGPVPDQRLLRIAPPSVKGLSLGTKERVLDANEWFIGANWACTRESFSDVGGFDETLGLNAAAGVVLASEETDLQIRLRAAGYRALYLPPASLRHVVRSGKCTLEHVAARAEAWGRYSRRNAPVERGPKTLRGVPLWRYRNCLERWVRSWAKRISGRDWYGDYIGYRADLGFLKGYPAHRGKGGE